MDTSFFEAQEVKEVSLTRSPQGERKHCGLDLSRGTYLTRNEIFSTFSVLDQASGSYCKRHSCNL